MLTPSETRRHGTQCRRLAIIDAITERNRTLLSHTQDPDEYETLAKQNRQLAKERIELTRRLPTADASVFGGDPSSVTYDR